MPVSTDELVSLVDRPCWYHGTQREFVDWCFPPPPKPGEMVAHRGIFFTSNRKFAKGAGPFIAVVSLSSSTKVLNAKSDYHASEQLRQAVMRNPSVSMLDNAQHDYWHTGWVTGDVLRMAVSGKMILGMERMISDYAYRHRVPLDRAEAIIAHNGQRALIECICRGAENLGYDALYGCEVDRHSEPGRVFAQPWLAVFNPSVVTAPNWLS